MSIVQTVIQAFGGLSKTAKALRHRNVTTVQGWRDRGHIPAYRFAEIREAAVREKVDLPKELRLPENKAAA